uniref:AAA family ATPase n=1 Tax=uncultured Halomonas sp. TaxID=173971 RepID=UPI003447261E
MTSLLGRNESGKSNLLKALHSLNPVEGFQALSPIKDFPRDRKLEDCTEHTPVLDSTWALSSLEKKELAKVFPRAAEVEIVTIRRGYGDKRYIGFENLPSLEVEEKWIKSKLRKILAAVETVLEESEDPHLTAIKTASADFESCVIETDDLKDWANTTKKAISDLEKAMVAAGKEFPEAIDDVLTDIQSQAEQVAGDEEAHKAGRIWVVSNMPKFIYLDEYPQLEGHQNLDEYNQRQEKNNLTDEDRYFAKLCKVAGMDPKNLQELAQDPETRNQLVNRASAVVTKEIRRLWSDRSLKVRFNLDGSFMDTLISDPTSVYDVEVNLNERSRGFQWFFAFYITFSADTDGDIAEDAILLLDEPGLYLHAKSQSDLLAHFWDDFENQIIYSTHSPFMVPTGQLDSIRTVNIGEKAGTTVTNDPSGDSRTLFPIQAALGYSLSQSLFVGPNNLVVEGITDYWILSSVSEYLVDQGKTGLSSKITMTPAGGAQKVSYMVALLSSEELNVVVLLDEEKDSKTTRDDLIKSKLINERNIVFVTEAFSGNIPGEADIEDLLDPKFYEELVRESYAKELEGKNMALNKNIPRIAKQVELALADIGVEFHKTRPTRLLLTKMSNDAKEVLTEETASQFEKLFEGINARFQKIEERGGTSLTPKTE